MTADPFDALAALPGVEDRVGRSPAGLLERYLYSDDYVHRYAFGRWWGKPTLGASAVWVLLNPATGDTEQRRRPTLERCIAWSRAAGHAGIVIVNLFAFRATDPRALRTAQDPVGPANDTALAMFTAAGAQTLVAWGQSRPPPRPLPRGRPAARRADVPGHHAARGAPPPALRPPSHRLVPWSPPPAGS